MSKIYALTIGGKTKRSTLGQRTVEIDWDKLPDESKDFAIRYGLRQYLADGMAGAANVQEADANVSERKRKLETADFQRARGEGKKVDTVETRALKLAKAAIRAQAKAKNLAPTKEQVDALAAKQVEANPKWIADARKQLADEAKAAELVDITELEEALAGLSEEDEEEDTEDAD